MEDKNKHHDLILNKIVEVAKTSCTKKNDDCLYLIMGPVGSGKSMLGLHMHQLYMGDEASVDYIGLNRDSFADAYGKAINKKGLRICEWDEANISRRDALNSFNKELISLYNKNRGLNIFHIWCNPSVQMIDQPFIKERIKGLFYCASKDYNIRPYYFIPKKGLLKILEKYKNLEEPTIKRVVGEYALYKGWFKDYQGAMRKEYNMKKGGEAKESSQEWVEKWKPKNKNLMKPREVAQKAGMSIRTIDKYITKGKLKEGEHFEVTFAGRRNYYPKVLDTIKEIAAKNKKKQFGREYEN